MPTRAEAAKNLLDGYDPNEIVATTTWSIGDIFAKAEEIEAALTISDAEEILETIHMDCSAEIGITWEVIEQAIRDYSID